MISRRAKQWGKHEAYLVAAHIACAKDPFDPDSNPNGYINFGTAENLLLFDNIKPLLSECSEIHEKDSHYNELYGGWFFRKAIAGFLSKRAGRRLSPSNIAVASGASAILEMLSFTLSDSGDGILIPAPYYAGFDHDLALRSDAQLVQIPLKSPEFKLTIEKVEEAYSKAASESINIRAILLNSPHNPLGQIYNEEFVRKAVDFAQDKNIHIILDEIYAESLQPGFDHFSALRLQNDFTHVVYGFAKDFGLSGYKVGILHSENQEVVKTVQDCSYFHTVSMQTQRTLANLLLHKKLDKFLSTMRERLQVSYNHVAGELNKQSIPFLPSQGGIVLLVDLSSFLPSNTK